MQRFRGSRVDSKHWRQGIILITNVAAGNGPYTLNYRLDWIGLLNTLYNTAFTLCYFGVKCAVFLHSSALSIVLFTPGTLFSAQSVIHRCPAIIEIQNKVHIVQYKFISTTVPNFRTIYRILKCNIW